MKYKIGDDVWYASAGMTQKTVTCPDCFGKKYLTVIKGDGEQVTIDCRGCQRGYEPPLGFVYYWEWEAKARIATIDRVEVTADGVEYGTTDNYRVKENELFDTKEEAEKRAAEKAEEHNKEELAKINRKEKHNRAWSWHAHYHRDCIKRAERDLAYHTAKLDAAKKHTKGKEGEK